MHKRYNLESAITDARTITGTPHFLLYKKMLTAVSKEARVCPGGKESPSDSVSEAGHFHRSSRADPASQDFLEDHISDEGAAASEEQHSRPHF